MKLQIVSDLHLEFGPIELEPYDRDLLILAGDIHVGQKTLTFLEEQLQHSPVIYVLGNHEYYQHDYHTIHTYWTSLRKQGLYILDNSSITIDDTEFLGCVLWSDMEGGDREAMEASELMMNDYRVIEFRGRALSPKDTMKIHAKSKKWLEKTLKPDRKQVVITHHLPSYRSVAEQYRGSPINGAFYSDLDHFIAEKRPDLWIHGHTHDSMDYELGQTRVVCNPRGYFPGQLNPNFRPDLILDI
ncbi:MAG: metallophosphoesterase [Candidatus Kariarchaeaceae archaeon]|jgi:Icc-related predicted phosphoesterase